MRIAALFLIAILVMLQAELWFGKGGLPRVWSLRQQVASQQAANAQAKSHNDQLAAEVRDLQEGLEMVEEKARSELGMVKPDEIYVQLTSRPLPAPTSPDAASGAAPAPRP